MVPTLGKAMHKALRLRLAAHFERASLPLQVGGKKGQSTTFASHMVRSFIRLRVSVGRTCSVLFSDIAAAYYGAVRGLVIRDGSQQHFDALSKDLPVSVPDKAALQALLEEPTAMEQQHAEPWL